MLKGIEHGVDIINDVSGFKYDSNSISLLKKYQVSKVLHHMQGTPTTMQTNPHYSNVLLDIYDFFEKNINRNFKDKKIILDPGIGFGKTLKHNLTLISKISLFHSLGFPIMIGTSRKNLLAKYQMNLIARIEQVGQSPQFYIYCLKVFKYLESTMYKK